MDNPKKEWTDRELAEWLVGDTQKLVSAVLVKHARGVVEGLRELHAENVKLKRDHANALQFAHTILTNLERGASVADVLEWAASQEAKRLTGT